MEAQAEVRSHNSYEKGAPAPQSSSEKTDSVAMASLLDKREKMIQGLNGAKSQRDVMQQRVKEYDLSINRTEGAIMALEGLIQEIDPEYFNRLAQAQQQQQMGG